MAGPARRYRRSADRYKAVRDMTPNIASATRLGCRDAVRGRKNPYKPEARGLVSAYREGARICTLIESGRKFSAEDARVAKKLDLHTEASRATRPLAGARRTKKRSR